MADVQQKLDKLLNKHTKYRGDFQQTLETWEKQLKQAIAVKDFGNHEIIKKVRKGYATEIKEIQDILLYKDVLTEGERERLFDKRAMCMRFLNLFREAEVTLENIEQSISFELGLSEDKEEV